MKKHGRAGKGPRGLGRLSARGSLRPERTQLTRQFLVLSFCYAKTPCVVRAKLTAAESTKSPLRRVGSSLSTSATATRRRRRSPATRPPTRPAFTTLGTGSTGDRRSGVPPLLPIHLTTHAKTPRDDPHPLSLLHPHLFIAHCLLFSQVAQKLCLHCPSRSATDTYVP
jgi:hypothetical protein